ncbi:hypothetical protein SAMN04487964_104160 [Marinobacterium sediminicola]|uniref:Uncharacterized protein n=1 Tax=Marinobacterium sediminicola TaxID=518898 RepID=A0ABY1RYV2_9GAMM|nr:hypothetical protein SAMN04487964_104160 [Marinobacterium sediminicola]
MNQLTRYINPGRGRLPLPGIDANLDAYLYPIRQLMVQLSFHVRRK